MTESDNGTPSVAKGISKEQKEKHKVRWQEESINLACNNGPIIHTFKHSVFAERLLFAPPHHNRMGNTLHLGPSSTHLN